MNDPPCAFSWFWCSPAEPPTSFWLLLTPIVMMPIVDQFFDVGIASIVSLATTCRLMTFCMSTTGLAPDTVTVSSSAPTLQVGIHRRRERRRELDPFALDG